MNGATAKLLRKASGNDRQKYRQLKKAYTKAPRHIREEGKNKARDLAEVERQQKELDRKLKNEKAIPKR